mmetsp:Transcript_14667/g.30561  ORF Transcript_14667/g.30561 Transcript_14667/m.30561 type:complete len:229 (+) Transcript_14667:162-848(+)
MLERCALARLSRFLYESRLIRLLRRSFRGLLNSRLRGGLLSGFATFFNRSILFGWGLFTRVIFERLQDLFFDDCFDVFLGLVDGVDQFRGRLRREVFLGEGLRRVRALLDQLGDGLCEKSLRVGRGVIDQARQRFREEFRHVLGEKVLGVGDNGVEGVGKHDRGVLQRRVQRVARLVHGRFDRLHDLVLDKRVDVFADLLPEVLAEQSLGAPQLRHRQASGERGRREG